VKFSIAIRVEASKQIGTGHLKRCILIANELKKNKVKVFFIKKNNHYNRFLKKLKYDYFLLKKNQSVIRQIKNFIINKKISLYYTDLLKPEIKVEKGLFKKIPIFVFEDNINPHICNYYFNPNIYKIRKTKMYKKVIAERKFLGKNYYIIDKIKKKKNKFNKNILISFGGSDNSNQTEKVIKALKDYYNSKYKIFICLGKNYKYKKRLFIKYKKIININFFSTEKLSNIIKNFNFTIGACGQSLLERIYLVKYSLSAITSENQVLFAKNINRYHATRIINLNTFPKKISINKWRYEIKKYLRSNISCKIKKNIFDAKGAQRISRFIVSNIKQV